MIPLIMNNKNKCREEINSSTSDNTRGPGGAPRCTKARVRRRGQRGEGAQGLGGFGREAGGAVVQEGTAAGLAGACVCVCAHVCMRVPGCVHVPISAGSATRVLGE